MIYPTTAELSAFILSKKFMASAPTDDELQRYIDESIEWLEDVTGWYPFLASGQVTTRYFTPPLHSNRGQVLDVEGGIYNQVGFAVYKDYVMSDQTSGTLLALNKDFLLWPQNQEGKGGRPFNEIYFINHVTGCANSIKIVNDWGYSNVITDRVFNAIQRKATSLALVDSEGRQGQVTRIRQGPVMYDYAAEESTIARLERRALEAVEKLARI